MLKSNIIREREDNMTPINIKDVISNIELLHKIKSPESLKIEIQEMISNSIIHCILFFLNIIADVIIFIFLNFKDASYLTSSLFKKWNDGKAQREIEQKEKKQAKLEAEIAEKQAMLDEMKKE